MTGNLTHQINVPENLKPFCESIGWRTSNVLEIKFSKVYNFKVLFHQISISNLANSMIKLEKKVKDFSPDISESAYNELEGAIYSSLEKAEGFQLDKSTREKHVTVNKYSRNGLGDLYEAVIIGGKPYFATLNKEKRDEVVLVDSINEPTITLTPPVNEEYLHTPYQFDTLDEFNELLKRVKSETIFSIYSKVSKIVPKYIDQEAYCIKVLVTDIIFSYFQDRFSTVHYLGIFGGNGTGKSSIGDIIEALAYRTMNTTDPTPANIFRSLGSIEPGQLTIVIDEADRIDQSPDMMAILKTGYHIKKIITRVNLNSGKPEKFFPFCKKTIIAERPPNPITARGISDRILPITAFPGNPDFDIKEIMNPTDTGGRDYAHLRNEIDQIRKILFGYRLIHFSDPIPHYNNGLTGRNKELTKPYLQLFSSTKSDTDEAIFQEVEQSMKRLLDAKNVKKDFTLEAEVIPMLFRLLPVSKTRMVTYREFWQELIITVKGHYDEKKPNEFHSEDHGTIYKNMIPFLLEKIGVRRRRHTNDIELIFDTDKLVKSAIQFNIPVQLSIHDEQIPIANEGYERYEGIKQSQSSFQRLDIANQCPEKSKTRLGEETYPQQVSEEDNNNKTELEAQKSTESESCYNHPQPSPSQPPQDNILRNKIKKIIYRIGNSDVWGCTKCDLRDDRWFMEVHPCRSLRSSS